MQKVYVLFELVSDQYGKERVVDVYGSMESAEEAQKELRNRSRIKEYKVN